MNDVETNDKLIEKRKISIHVLVYLINQYFSFPLWKINSFANQNTERKRGNLSFIMIG